MNQAEAAQYSQRLHYETKRQPSQSKKSGKSSYLLGGISDIKRIRLLFDIFLTTNRLPTKSANRAAITSKYRDETSKN
jgi:hypothetical protein